MEAHQQVTGKETPPEGRGPVSNHQLRHREPFAARFSGPSFFFRHQHCDGRSLQLLLGLDVSGNGIAGKAVTFAADLKPQRRKPAAAVDHGDDKSTAPTGTAMDDVQMLHTKKRTDVHPSCNLKRHQAVGKTVLPLELRWNQRATGQSFRDALGIFKSFDARKN